MKKNRLQSSKPMRFQSYGPKLDIPKRFLDMIDSVEVTADGQLQPDLPWLNELKNSIKEHPGNQLILDAIGEFGQSLSQGQKSKLDMFLKVLEKGEQNMGVGDTGTIVENRLQKSVSGEGDDGDETNGLLSPERKRMVTGQGDKGGRGDDRFVGFEQKFKKADRNPFGTHFPKGSFIPQTEVHRQKMQDFQKNNEFWIGDQKMALPQDSDTKTMAMAQEMVQISGQNMETQQDENPNKSSGLNGSNMFLNAELAKTLIQNLLVRNPPISAFFNLNLDLPNG